MGYQLSIIILAGHVPLPGFINFLPTQFFTVDQNTELPLVDSS
jgi:hypothetical protein